MENNKMTNGNGGGNKGVDRSLNITLPDTRGAQEKTNYKWNWKKLPELGTIPSPPPPLHC